jgi:hypothetical protein
LTNQIDLYFLISIEIIDYSKPNSSSSFGLDLISVFLSEVSELNIRAFFREFPHFLQYCHCHESVLLLLHLPQISWGGVLGGGGFSFKIRGITKPESATPPATPMPNEKGRIRINLEEED